MRDNGRANRTHRRIAAAPETGRSRVTCTGRCAGDNSSNTSAPRFGDRGMGVESEQFCKRTAMVALLGFVSIASIVPVGARNASALRVPAARASPGQQRHQASDRSPGESSFNEVLS